MASDDKVHRERLTVLIEMHKEMRQTALWQEASRERTASIIIAANTILLSVVAGAGFSIQTVFLSIFVILLANLGKRFAVKYYYLQERDYTRARAIRIEIDDMVSRNAKSIADIFADAKRLQIEEFEASKLSGRLSKIKRAGVHYDWYAVHNIYIAFSIIFILISLALLVFDIKISAVFLDARAFILGVVLDGG